MSATWGSLDKSGQQQSEKLAKRMIRMWGMLTIAALFLLYVSQQLGVTLF